ncbi:hypothetical protein IMZ30_09460 [Psychroflexus sp. ALD_RP9]|nr:hypothetical protein IMZ30_09460 [Psychroflexus sp. ALD_RP9]
MNFIKTSVSKLGTTFLYNRSYYGIKISDFQLQNPSEQIRVDSAYSRISRNCGYAVLQVGFFIERN